MDEIKELQQRAGILTETTRRFYQIVPVSELPDIEKDGLKPTAPRKSPGKPKYVYMFNNRNEIEKVFHQWLGGAFLRTYKFALLQITVMADFPMDIVNTSGVAIYRTKEIIPADAIKVITRNY